jgi:hypothetical protein
MAQNLVLLSANGTVRIILIILLVYFLYSFFMRWLAPLIARRYINHMQEHFFGQQTNNQNYSRKKTGEITIEKVDQPNSKQSEELIEDIDYEEIK